MKTNHDQETTSEEGVTEEPPATEENMTTVPPATEETTPTTNEVQPAIVQEESVPPCPEGQALDEESGLFVLKEPKVEEQSEEDRESENNGSEDGNAEEASD